MYVSRPGYHRPQPRPSQGNSLDRDIAACRKEKTAKFFNSEQRRNTPCMGNEMSRSIARSSASLHHCTQNRSIDDCELFVRLVSPEYYDVINQQARVDVRRFLPRRLVPRSIRISILSVCKAISILDSFGERQKVYDTFTVFPTIASSSSTRFLFIALFTGAWFSTPFALPLASFATILLKHALYASWISGTS